jgi:trehalose 6-phosphate synthase
MLTRPTSTTEGQQLIVLANREPYRHERDARGHLRTVRSSSGVVNAVEPLLLEHSGVWIAEGVGDSDRVAASDRDGVAVPVDGPRYRLRRLFLDADEQHGYYNGFANGALWPLCHRTPVEPTFFARDFHSYELVNRRFADAVAEEARDRSPIVLVQDYHFALAPQLIRRQLPLSRIATFWHIPWPRPETFSVCPWSRALLEGLLGSTAIGFQTAADAQHFLATAELLLQASVDRHAGLVTYKDRCTSIAVLPASIDWSDLPADTPSPAACRRAVLSELDATHVDYLGVSVDRLDYTKGLDHKFLAIERLLEQRPDLAGRFLFVQLAQPCREGIQAYRTTRQRVREIAARVNERFDANGGPIRLIEANHAPDNIDRFFRAADFCYVGSLHDGMNLVSKEFVRARDDERGVLMLSAWAGAAQELSDALIVNPYDLEGVARALATALDMAPAEQRTRLRRMRQHVAQANARQWARAIVAAVAAPADAARPQAWTALAAKLPALMPPRALVASDVSVS